jgi:hypothetical protein
MGVNGLLLDLNVLMKESKDIGLFYTENIRNVYGVYIDKIVVGELDGTIQEMLYRKLGEQGLSQADIDARMELFINEMAYAYYNVAGHDKMLLAEGAREVLDGLGGSPDFVMGIATPVVEKVAQNMMERAGIDTRIFRFAEYGAFGRDANALLAAAATEARRLGADAGSEGVFVSGSPYMISCAGIAEIRTVAVTGRSEERFVGTEADAVIKTLKDLRKGLADVFR